LGGANLILQCAPSEAADQATACVLEIVSLLPLTHADLMETQVALGTRLPAANWSSAFPPAGSGASRRRVMRFTARPRVGGRRAAGRWRLCVLLQKVVCVSLDLTCFYWEVFWN